MGISLLFNGRISEGREHFDQALALYDPAEHRQLATRFGVDARASILSYRSWALWSLGYPKAALADIDNALKDARDIGQAATLMYVLLHASWPQLWSGNYVAANTLVDEVAALADQKGALHWQSLGMIARGCLFAMTGKASNALHMISAGITANMSTGATLWMPLNMSYLTRAYVDLGQFDDAWHRIAEAMTAIETTKERWCEAEIHRMAGEIALHSPERNAAKAQDYFECALAVARQQQAKSWELRAATSMARLWRDQSKVQQARELLAPVYGWFTQGFETLDLKEAKALLEELA